MTNESQPSPDEVTAPALDALIGERRKKREELARRGIDPYPPRFDRTVLADDLHGRHADLEPDSRTGDEVRLAGRVTVVRCHGKLSFATQTDTSGSIQLLLQAATPGEDATAVLDTVDLGDWVGAEGEVITSRLGELSVDVTRLTLVSKSLRPLPDKWHGLTETDTRYRQREVDLLVNPDSRRVFDVRCMAIAAMRRLLESEHFVEVETPIRQPQAGGAIARPFRSHPNALDIQQSLRMAPELYLKRLVVGGYERVFEIARNFRNEGVSTRHSREFTALEAFRAFGGANDAMDLTEALVVAAARESIGRFTVHFGDTEIDLTPPWPRRQLLDVLEERLDGRVHPTDDVDDLRAVCEQRGVTPLPEWGPGKLVFELYDQVLMPELLTRSSWSGSPSRYRPWPATRRTTPRWPTGSSCAWSDASSPTATPSSTSPRSRPSGSRCRPRPRPGGHRGPPRGTGLRPQPAVRAAAHGRHRYRHRPVDHAVGRGRCHPRRDPLPHAAARSRRLTAPPPAGASA